jgi:hypothetical protein
MVGLAAAPGRSEARSVYFAADGPDCRSDRRSTRRPRPAPVGAARPMNAEFQWWLLILGMVIGGALVYLVLADMRSEEVAADLDADEFLADEPPADELLADEPEVPE